jgi:hypothetical protein
VQGGQQLLVLVGSKELHGVEVVLHCVTLEEIWRQSPRQLSVISAQMVIGDLGDLGLQLKI